ncbi:MAG: ABC transporter ATP-binding protein [bacterium]
MKHFKSTEEAVRSQSVRELLPKLIPLFAGQKRLFFISLALLALTTATALIGPLVLQHIIDVAIPQADTGELWLAAGIYLGVILIGSIVSYFQAIALFSMGIRIITDLKERLFRHVLFLGLGFHSDYPPGKLISRVENDTETLKELFGDVSVNLLRNFVLFFGIISVMLLKDLRIASYVLIMIPLLFGATFWYLNFMKKYWRESRAQVAIVIGYIAEYMQGMDVIQQFNYQKRARERMAEVNMGKYRIDTLSQYIEYGFWAGFIFGEIIAICVVLVVAIQGVVDGTVSLGILVMFIEFIRQMFQPIMELSGQLNFVQRGLISVERVFGILETEISIKDGPRDASELKFEQEIRFENVWFAYEDNAEGEPEWILKDVSFTVRKGQKIAFVGPSGGGKSTTINLLLRFYDPQQGRVTVDGVDIREFPVKAWRELLGLVLQDIYLFPGSVKDNIRVFDDSISDEQVRNVAQIARADEIVAKLKDGYDGELAERGANLSVGERQLLSFARALAYDPPVLVLDEATSSVDPHTEQMVQEAIDRLLEGRTAMIVAHRLSTILNSDRIMVIKGGQLVESGTHEELYHENGVYTRLVQLQFGDRSDQITANLAKALQR